MTGEDPEATRDEPPRWPRRRTLDPRRRWDPDHPAEDVPTIASTVALTGFGMLVLAGLAWLSAMAAAVVIALLLMWSVGLEISGGTVTRRVRNMPHRIVWVAARPAYAVGLAVWAILEGLFELVFG